jgi:type IV secretory pathway TrbD component
VTTSVVVVTGNHYWLDAIVGVLLLAVAIAVVALVTRRPEPARGWSPVSRAGDHCGGPGGRG